MTIHTYAGPAELSLAVAKAIELHLSDVQSTGCTPSLVLTGGTIAGQVYRALGGGAVDWSGVTFYWGDERFVPAGHDNRNDKQAREAFLDRLFVPESNIVAMPAHDCSLSAADAAASYGPKLPADAFDLVLLGVGPDGHVASLFPGHSAIDQSDRSAIAILDSPKPPAQRISLTLPRLNRARQVWLIVSGQTKSDAVAAALSANSDLPAALVHGSDSTRWFLDQAAAGKLSSG